MKRREALMAVAGVTACGALAAAGLVAGASEAAGVVAIIHKRLGYLKLDNAGVAQFARDFAARDPISAGKLRAISAAEPLYGWVPQAWFNFLTPDVPYGEERVVTMFLLSTDFFPHADERRTVRYREIFDAQRRANPFARLLAQTAV